MSPVKEQLAKILWIGGSPCSGKSTIADWLAKRHGLTVYRCDDAYYQHANLITPERQPTFFRLAHASCDQLWMRPIEQQVSEELELYRGEFPLILADLKAMPAGSPIVAEGAALLPELLAGINIESRRAVWVVPTEPFQRDHYVNRAWRHDVLERCTDKERAWQNWMARDAGFATSVAHDTRTRKYRILTVDGTRTIGDMAHSIETHFGL